MGHGTSIAMWQNKPAKNGDQGLAPTEAGHITILGLLIDYQLPSFYQYIMISIYIYMHWLFNWWIRCYCLICVLYIYKEYVYVYIYMDMYMYFTAWLMNFDVFVHLYIYTPYIYIIMYKNKTYHRNPSISLYNTYVYIIYIYYTAYVHWCFQKLEVHRVEKQFYDRPGRVTLPH